MSSINVSPPSEVQRFLRKISIFIMLPAFPILMGSGFVSNIILFFGLIPHAFSVKIGAYLLRHPYNERPLKMSMVVFFDFLIGFVYLGLLIPVWIEPTHRWYQTTEIMLAAYATCFMIINMAIHFYFGAYNLITNYADLCSARECPSCRARHAEEHGSGMPAANTKTADKGPKYSLLGDDNEDSATPRTSEEIV